MNEIILNYIVQSILGGASGYITNDYAINMLFKEYTPLKIGGVIKKTRHEFIENISSMVENDIINKEKLQEILQNESFKKEFENMTVDFFEKSLYETTDGLTFSNIDGLEKTIESTDIFAEKIINEQLPKLYELIAKNISIQDFFNSDQLDKISSSLYSTLTEIIHNTDIFENMIISVFKNNDSMILKNVLESESINSIISNAVHLLAKEISCSDIEKISELLDLAGLNKAINSSAEILKSKKVKEIINLDNNALYTINQGILSYVNSEKGKNFISSLTNSLFSYGKECNKSIFQLLDSSFEESLKLYLIENIPSVTENVVDWINLNSHLIDKLIEESIDEVIKESDGIKARLLSVIKNTYFSSLSKKYSIVDKIIAYVKKVSEPENLSKNLSAKIIEILNGLTVREIILEAEENHITPENASKLVLNYINDNSESLINKSAAYISEIELNKLLPFELLNDRFTIDFTAKIKDLVVSDFAVKYFITKSTEYADIVLSKELRDLIDDEKTKTAAIVLKEFIEGKIESNENSIKELINIETLEIAKTYSSINLNSEIIYQLNDELFKNYNEAAKGLSEVRLSTALDKLNSMDNLAKNSSESLRTYAVKNSDVILSGSVKAIATDNLNKLNDDELVGLANDFIGRELRPIMYFGGVLGVIAGLTLAAFQNSAHNPGEINIANMLVYAFVGYITNVVAINMIFKPYKEIKILSKIPFLRNFSLGYIVKNQKIFAKNTAHFIDNSLLNKKSINELFDKYKDKIKSSFTRTIADNNYNTLNNLLYKNKEAAAKGIFSFLSVKLRNNLNNISIYIYNKISSIHASTLLNEKAIKKVESQLTSRVQSSKIHKNIYSLISSEATLDSKVSVNIIRKYINESGKNYLNKLCVLLSNRGQINKIILINEDKYERYINKTIAKAIGTNKEKLTKAAGEKISSIVLSKESRDKITQKAIALINKSIDRNKDFEELFDGKFKSYMDSQVPLLLEKMTSAVVSNIKGNKSKISLMVQAEIKNNLGFIEKSMYTLMGGDEIIDELLTKIIMVKVPRFLDDKKLELNSIANILLQERLYKAKVDVLYTGINKLQLNEIVNSYVSDNSLKIENKIDIMTSELFTKTENIKLISILKLIYADNLNNLLNKYEEEINTFANELNLNISNNKLQIIEKLSDYTDLIINKFMKTQFKDLFAGVSEDNIKYTQDKIILELYRNKFEDIINMSLNEFKNHLNMNMGEFIDREEFIKAAEKNLVTIIENSEFENTVKGFIEDVIDEAVSVNFDFIGVETKYYLLNMFVDSCISSLMNRLDEILKAIEFDEITREEIEKMEPEKIHEMFDSFAGKYFKRLMLYGFGGFVFGINMYVGFSLTLLKIISELTKKGPRN